LKTRYGLLRVTSISFVIILVISMIMPYMAFAHATESSLMGTESSGNSTSSVASETSLTAASATSLPRSRGVGADFVIDIGIGPPTIPGVVPHPTGAGTGYSVTAGPNRTIDFNTVANTYTYEITQTGGSSGFWTINLPTGVNTTIILRDINASVYIHMNGNAHLNLLLAGDNIITAGYITVREFASITIDSADVAGSELGSLNITSAHGGYAAIGGYYNTSSTPNSSHSGNITINGGTIIATHNSGQTPSAAVIGGAYGTQGTININGGYVSATALNSSSAAAIGGGQGAKGTVSITGGTVVATISTGGSSALPAYRGGAAIGGGAGGGTPTSGNAYVSISGGKVIASAYNGAAIGGGMLSANAVVEILAGEIIASTSGLGAAIGGGGGTTGGSNIIVGAVDVSISGGHLELKASNGAAVGNGGYQSGAVPVHSDALSGIVSITGGEIIADVNQGNGIGTGWNNKVIPQFQIDTGADIIVFGRTRTSFAGIYAGDNTSSYGYGMNTGDAYYINLGFPDSGAQMKEGTTLLVFPYGGTENPIRNITVPYDIGMLSFTMGDGAYAQYSIFAQTTSGYIQLAHASAPLPSPLPLASNIVYNDGNIYTVNQTFSYYNNGHVHDTYFRSLPVKAGSGFGYYHLVTERYINMSGNPISSQTMKLVPVGGAYTKSILSIPGYTYKGYKWDGLPIGGDYIAANPTGELIYTNRLIYFVYDTYQAVPTGIKNSDGELGLFTLATVSLTTIGLLVFRYIKRKVGV